LQLHAVHEVRDALARQVGRGLDLAHADAAPRREAFGGLRDLHRRVLGLGAQHHVGDAPRRGGKPVHTVGRSIGHGPGRIAFGLGHAALQRLGNAPDARDAEADFPDAQPERRDRRRRLVGSVHVAALLGSVDKAPTLVRLIGEVVLGEQSPEVPEHQADERVLGLARETALAAPPPACECALC
jgi:hypothetical protein